MKEITVRIKGDVEDSELKTLENEIRKIKNERLQLKIDANNSELRAIDNQIDELQTELSQIHPLNIKVDPAAREEAERLKREIQELENDRVNIKLDIDEAELNQAKNQLKNLDGETKNTSNSMGMLSNAASTAIGMVGYDLANSVMESTRASINARQSMEAFASRLNMTGTEVKDYQSKLDEMQQSYKKIDMDVVGKQASDMAYRLGLPKTSLGELTETTAIFTDAMQRNGRSAEDSMLAMSDAMDGQFVRLKEIGIQQDDLKKNGWSGDINDKTGLLNAMNKALKEQNYDKLAKSVDNLDDAWQVLSVSMGNLLEKVLVPLTPIITGIVEGITGFMDVLMNNPLGQIVGLIGGLSVGFALLAGGISVAAAAEGGIMAIMPGFITSLYGAASGFMAITVAGAPLWAIVAAVAAIAFAVYEVGIAFGWWSDVGTMFDAIKAGVMGLWDAFMSNEYVIQAIDLIKQGLTDAWNAISGFGQAIMSALSGGAGEFDILGFMIQNLQMILNAVGPYVILAIQGIIQVFRNLYTLAVIAWPYITQAVSTAMSIIGGVVNTGKAIFSGLMSVWNQCSSTVQAMANTISGALSAAGSAWNGFKDAVMKTIQPIIDGAKQVGDAVSGAMDWITGSGGIETPTVGGTTGAGGYGAGSQTITQGNTIIFNMYGDVKDEKTLDDMVNAINDRLAFDSLANNGVNPDEGAV